MKKKTYLADGVYADFDGFHIILTVENGIEATDTIYLDDTVLAAFDLFREKHLGVATEESEESTTDSSKNLLGERGED